MTLYNPNVGPVVSGYAAHSDGKVYLVTAGDGQLWVDVGNINSSNYGGWINVYYSDLKLNEEFLCENGNGAQLTMKASGANRCRWHIRPPAPISQAHPAHNWPGRRLFLGGPLSSSWMRR